MSKNTHTPDHQPKRSPGRTVKRVLAAAALTATAVLTPGISTAQAETHAHKGQKIEHHDHSLPSLERRTAHKLKRGEEAAHYNGTLSQRVRLQDPNTKEWIVDLVNIDNPILVHRTGRKEPARHGQHSGITDQYFFGSVDDKLGEPVVTLLKYDPETMVLTPADNKGPEIEFAGLLGDRAATPNGFNLAVNGRGKPLVDGFGVPEYLGLRYYPQK